jgi:hypothetical protein
MPDEQQQSQEPEHEQITIVIEKRTDNRYNVLTATTSTGSLHADEAVEAVNAFLRKELNV